MHNLIKKSGKPLDDIELNVQLSFASNTKFCLREGIFGFDYSHMYKGSDVEQVRVDQVGRRPSE